MPLNPTRLRTMVDGWLTDTCTIRDPGAVTFDEDQGVDVPSEGATVYDGKCRLRPTGGERIVIAGDAPITLRMFDLTVPWDTTGLKVNQVVTMGDSSDPHVEGRRYTVVDVQGGTDTAYRRLVVEDTLTVAEPEEGS